MFGSEIDFERADGDDEDVVRFISIRAAGEIGAFVFHLNRLHGTAWRVVETGGMEEVALEDEDPFARERRPSG